MLGVAMFLVWTSDAPSAADAPERSYYVYVCAESEDEVALVRYGPAGLEVVKTIKVGSFPAATEGPHGIDVGSDGRHWYVSIAHGFPFGSIHKYETETDEWGRRCRGGHVSRHADRVGGDGDALRGEL